MSVTSDSVEGPPILELKGSHFAAEGLAGATTLRVFSDRVETDQRVGLRHEKHVVRLDQIEDVETRSDGRQWDTIVITAANGDAVEVPGLSKEAANEAAETIRSTAGVVGTEGAASDSTSGSSTGSTSDEGAAPSDEDSHSDSDEPPKGEPETMDLGDALRHLNSLRAEGAISEEEFSRRKAELFSSRG